MKKRVISLLLVGAIALISGCNKQEQTTTAQTPVTLNEVAHSIFYAPQYVAIENGYFAEWVLLSISTTKIPKIIS